MTLYAERKPSRHRPFAIIETRGSGKYLTHLIRRPLHSLRHLAKLAADRENFCLSLYLLTP